MCKEKLIEQDKLHKEEMKEMAECIERYEKALDKACMYLEWGDIGFITKTRPNIKVEEYERKELDKHEFGYYPLKREEIKEWLLKDE